MIVYSSLLRLADQDPRPVIRAAFQTWLEQKLKRKLAEEILLDTRTDLGRGHVLEAENFEYREEQPSTKRPPEHDWSMALRYSHPDRAVHGRRWVTEVGVCKWRGKHSMATVRLQTEEQSALANVPIETTQPRLVQLMLNTCELHDEAPGGEAVELRKRQAQKLLDYLRDPRRTHPVVVVSHGEDGRVAVPPEQLAERLVGIADVMVVPADEDTIALQRQLDPGLVPYRGALNILWPVSRDFGRIRIPYNKILGEVLEELRASGKEVAAEVMARVCHETNRDVASNHIDIASVRAQRQRLDLDLARAELASGAGPKALELLAMYEQTEKDDKKKMEELKSQLQEVQAQLTTARSDTEEARDEERLAQNKAKALENALEEAKLGAKKDLAVSPDLAEAFRRALDKAPTLTDCLRIVEHIFPTRVVVLPTARKSAAAARKFRDGNKALNLLWKLCSEYHDSLGKGGSGDRQAIEIFGKTCFAARESETVENNTKARQLRTFPYKGDPVFMPRHLKIHVKESDATTFRCHFHWAPENRVVVIGHCGGHLDHG